MFCCFRFSERRARNKGQFEPFHFSIQVDEEEDLVEGTQSGPFTFHMEVHSCTQTQDRFDTPLFHLILMLVATTSYVCTHKKGGQAGFVTERTILSCCPGHRWVLVNNLIVVGRACLPAMMKDYQMIVLVYVEPSMIIVRMIWISDDHFSQAGVKQMHGGGCP